MNAVIQTFIPSGDPHGLKVVNIKGWDGVCLIASRPYLAEMRERPESSRPGLYFLLGEDEERGEKMVYIGESESVGKRITSHNLNNDFWDTVLVFTGNVNRADVKYLEHRSTYLAQDAKRYVVRNKVQPAENTLSEADRAVCDQYFEKVQFLLSAFGYTVFSSLSQSQRSSDLYHLKGKSYHASGRLLQSGEFVVYQQSTARMTETRSFTGWSQRARKRFLEERKFVPDDNSYIVVQDIVFKSPSAAASTIAGSALNGWTAWKDGDGKTLDENVRNTEV